MSNKYRPETMLSLFVALFVCAVVAGSYLLSAATKPDCPPNSQTRLTQSGWYCTVAPLPRPASDQR